MKEVKSKASRFVRKLYDALTRDMKLREERGDPPLRDIRIYLPTFIEIDGTVASLRRARAELVDGQLPVDLVPISPASYPPACIKSFEFWDGIECERPVLWLDEVDAAFTRETMPALGQNGGPKDAAFLLFLWVFRELAGLTATVAKYVLWLLVNDFPIRSFPDKDDDMQQMGHETGENLYLYHKCRSGNLKKNAMCKGTGLVLEEARDFIQDWYIDSLRPEATNALAWVHNGGTLRKVESGRWRCVLSTSLLFYGIASRWHDPPSRPRPERVRRLSDVRVLAALPGSFSGWWVARTTRSC